MEGPLRSFNLRSPVLAAPMSGGPSTPALVLAAATAGSLGFLAGGYKTAEQLAAQIEQTRGTTPTFGVNLFVGDSLPVDPDAFRRYAAALQAEADRYGIDLADATPLEDDDGFSEKAGLLLADPVPVVSFTFNIPDASLIARLRAAGSVVLQTVTSLAEARQAAEARVDGLIVQGSGAGGHYGTLTPLDPPTPVALDLLVGQVHDEVRLPVLGAGGLATSGDIAAVMQKGADAVMVGTVLLCTDESGASDTYKTALGARKDVATIVTRAFSGRPARAIPNRFTDSFDAVAPAGYPALHHLTTPLRRAAAEAGDPELINIWAGVNHRLAEPGSASAVLDGLAAGL